MVGASHPAAVRTNRLAGNGGLRSVATLRGVRGLAAGLRGGAMGHRGCRCAISAIGGSATGVGGMGGAATARPVFASASELGTWQVGGGAEHRPPILLTAGTASVGRWVGGTVLPAKARPVGIARRAFATLALACARRGTCAASPGLSHARSGRLVPQSLGAAPTLTAR